MRSEVQTVATTPARLNAAIWWSAAVTFAAVVVIAQFRQSETGAAVEHRILVQAEPVSPKQLVAALTEEARGLDDAAVMELVRNSVTTKHPMVVFRMGRWLVSDRDDREAGRLGVIILETGANLYRTPSLLNAAGWQFYQGSFVERDFAKAVRFLSDPRMRYWADAKYSLGRVLYDARNPERDVEAGLALIRAAAARGNEPARAWLERNGERGGG